MNIYLEISGEDCDYGAMSFLNDNSITTQEIYEEMKSKKVTYLEKEINGEIYYFTIKKFDNVSDFKDYVFDEFVDYDYLKSKDLIEVKE